MLTGRSLPELIGKYLETRTEEYQETPEISAKLLGSVKLSMNFD